VPPTRLPTDRCRPVPSISSTGASSSPSWSACCCPCPVVARGP